MTWGGLPSSVPIGYIVLLRAAGADRRGARATGRARGSGGGGPIALLAVGFAVGFVWAFLFNAMLGARLGVFYYGRVIPGLAIFEGTKHQYPIYDAVAMALQMMVFAYLLGRTDAAGSEPHRGLGGSGRTSSRVRRSSPSSAVVVVGARPVPGGVRAPPRHEAEGRGDRRPDRAAVPRRREPAAARRLGWTCTDRDRRTPMSTTRARIRGSLRPLRRRHRRRSVSDVDPPAGRGPAVPERGARVLGDEPLGRRQAGAARLGDVPLRSRHRARDREGRRRDPTGDPAVRGPADPRRPPGAAVPRLHAAADAGPRTAGARLRRQGARRAARAGRVRRHRRVRRRDPAAHHRVPLRHPRGRPGRVPQGHRRRDLHRRHADRVRPVVVRHGAVRARRLRRVAVARTPATT